MRRQRVHQPYEIGGAPAPLHGRQRRQRGLDLASRPGGAAAIRRPPVNRSGPEEAAALRARGRPAAAPPSACPRPGPPDPVPAPTGTTPASAALRAAPPRCPPPPAAASGPRARRPGSPAPDGAARHVRPRRARPGRRSGDPRQVVPAPRTPSPSPARSRTSAAPRHRGRTAGRAGRETQGGGTEEEPREGRRPCRVQPPEMRGSHDECRRVCPEWRIGGAWERGGSARVFARS